MKNYSFFAKIKHSINDPNFYIEIIQEKMSSAVAYLIFFILIVGLVSGIIRGLTLSREISQSAEIVQSDDFPDFNFSNGTLTVDAPQPIILDDSDQLRIIIDTTGESTINDLAGYQIGYLLTDSKLVISSLGSSPISYAYSLLPSITLDKESLITTMTNAKRFIFPLSIIIMPFVLLFSNFYKSIMILVIAYLIKAFNQIRNLRMGSTYKIVLYSMTVGILLHEILSLIILLIPALFGTYSIVASITSYLPFIAFYLPIVIVLHRAFRAYRLKDRNDSDHSSGLY